MAGSSPSGRQRYTAVPFGIMRRARRNDIPRRGRELGETRGPGAETRPTSPRPPRHRFEGQSGDFLIQLRLQHIQSERRLLRPESEYDCLHKTLPRLQPPADAVIASQLEATMLEVYPIGKARFPAALDDTVVKESIDAIARLPGQLREAVEGCRDLDHPIR